MRYIISVFLVCFFLGSKSQITLNEMIKVYDMDFDQFETFSTNKGFSFDDMIDSFYYSQVFYNINNKVNQETIGLFRYKIKEEGYYPIVTQTYFNQNDYLKFKTQIEINGFKFVSTSKELKGYLSEYYKYNKWQICVRRLENERKIPFFVIALTKFD